MKSIGVTRSVATAAEPTVRRSVGRRRMGALAVAFLMLGSALALYGLPGASAAPTSPAHTGLSATSTATPATAASASPTVATPSSSVTTPLQFSPHPAGAPSATGRGTFLDSRNLSQVSVANLSCQHLYYTATPLCVNTTFDPSINITSTGEIGVVNTQFTDYTHCPNVFNISNNTTLDVGFQSSTNGGLTWSPIVYLGNQNCSQAQNLSEAMEPSLTSLANGTLVVTYIQFSMRTCPYYYCELPNPPDIYPYDIAYDNLVVQESYNGGANWTAPQVLNSTYNPNAGNCVGNVWSAFRPWVSATGNSVYVVWENYTDYATCDFSNPYSSGIHLISSTNGGQNWSNASIVNFPTIGDRGSPICCNYATNFSVNPTVLAEPNGQVYVAYATGLSYANNLCQPSGCLPYSIWSQDVVVANTTNVSGNWTVNIAATNVPLDYYEGGSGNYYGPFTAIAPTLAYDAIDGQLFVAYDSLAIGTFCYTYSTYHYCYPNEYEQAAFLQNSSNGGKNWSAATQIGNAVDPYGGPENYEYYPTIVVDHNGTLHATVSYYNETLCVTITYYFCGGYEQLYFNSTDSGTSWNGPYIVSAYYITGNDYAYLGEYETATVAPSGAVYFAWTNSACTPGTTGPYCFYLDYYYAEPNTSTVVSWLYQGVGLTVTFAETNLTAAANWGAELMGNFRQATAGTNLVVSGVPSGFPVLWSVPWVNISYGTAWEPVAAPSNPAPPSAFTTSPTLSFAFQELVQVIVTINPPIDTYYVTPGSNEATYSMTPLPATTWTPVNSAVSFVVAPQAINCATSYCFYYNLTWVSWTGTGTGSVSTNATSFTTTVGTTPINETANFLFLGYCENYVYGLGTLTCYNANGYPLTFHESGLPNGTAWGVTTVLNSSANGTVTSTSSNEWLNVSGGQTAVQFTAWTVPASTAGEVWVPTTTPSSPVKEPTQTLVNVSYVLASVNTLAFDANFTALGLPNGSAWSAVVGNASYAVTEGNLTVPVAGGQSLNLTGAPVYTENGVGYYASSVSVYPYVMNESWSNATVLPESYTFNGSAHVYVQYEPMFWLTVSASSGGNVTPTSQWVPTGNAVGITATASPGYHFLDWTSVGAGGSTVAEEHNASVTIHPTAPVNELATFRQDPAATWNVTVSANGLPAGTGFTFTLGNVTYTATGGTTTVGELLNGSYAFATATSYSALDNGTRWVPTSWYASYGAPVAGSLPIASNGMIVVNYTTQYVLSVTSTPNGVVTPGVGSTWTNAGTAVVLTATPSFHYKFVGWNGSGNGSVTSPTATMVTVTLNGPVWEAAAFDYRVFPPPAVYQLMVTETGLPTGTSWNVSAGTLNASAAGPEKNLTLSGLNGTYTLTVPSVYVSAGVRYVAPPMPVTVSANQSASVTFTEQFALTVAASAGGSVSGAGTTWVASGNSTTLSATASSGYQFAGWVGTGTGSSSPYTGTSASQPLTVAGPTNETATFVPVVKPTTTGSSTAGQVPALGLLAVLLVVGLVVGLIAGRRRSGGSQDAAEEAPADDGTGGGEAAPAEESLYGSAPENAPPTPEYDESSP